MATVASALAQFDANNTLSIYLFEKAKKAKALQHVNAEELDNPDAYGTFPFPINNISLSFNYYYKSLSVMQAAKNPALTYIDHLPLYLLICYGSS